MKISLQGLLPLLAVLWLAATGALATRAGTASRPNVVVFLADDAGYGDIGANGAVTIETPNIDRIARAGTKFTQWYAGAPLCTPSRASLLTGRYPIRSGMYTNFTYPMDLAYRVLLPFSPGGLPSNETTIADLLRPAGYNSAVIGKWHLGHVDALPTQRGFDYFWGAPYSHDIGEPGAPPLSTIFPPVPVMVNTTIVQQPVDLEGFTDRMTDQVVDFIDDSIAASKPFFVLVSYLQPHIPVFANSRFKGSSRRGAFGDMMHEMDDSIGRVMAALEERGLTGDTLVVFTSDNGAWPDAREPLVDEDLSDDQPHGGSNGPFQQGKGSTWEGGVREPTIISWPNGSIKSGATSMEIASHMDVLPTVLEAAGVSVPTDRTIDGRSLLPHMRGLTSSGPHDAYFYWREREVYAVRLGRYKAHFVTRPGFGNDRPVRHNPPLLFDLEADMGEQYPLDSAGRYADLIADMRRRVAEHRTTIEAVEPQYEFGGTILPGVDFSVVPCCNPMALQEFTIEQLVNDHWEQCRCDYLSGQAPASPEEGTTGESATEAERSVRRTAQELLAADLTRGGHSSTAAVMAELLLKQMSGPRHT